MLLLGRRAFLAGVSAVSTLHALRARAASDDPIATFPLSLAFAEDGGQRVQDAAWIAAQLGEVERLYAPLGIHVRPSSERTLGPTHLHVETRQDRDRFAAECIAKTVNVFVVGSLRDVDDGVTLRRGVHWRHTQHHERRYLILSAIAWPSVLAHELGHYFGNGHSRVPDNLMSYDRTGAEVFLDAAQAATIRKAARLALASGELCAVSSAP